MPLFRAILLGLLQGITEFLPVSSSGHLTIVPWLLHWDAPGLTFDTMVHLGTLIAVLLFFWADILLLARAWWGSVRRRKAETPEARTAWLLILSAVPGAVLGYFLEDFFAQLFNSPLAVSFLFLVTGGLIFIGERLSRPRITLAQIHWRDALTIGLAQGLAIAPGLSRSGATISAGLLRGLGRDEAARFSFLMAIPIVAGATGFQLLKTVSAGISFADGLSLLVGFAVALASGYFAIKFLLGYVQRHNLRPFAYYCWALGLIGILLSLTVAG